MVAVGVREDMLVLEEMHDPARLPDTVWQEVAPAKNHRDPPPRRQIIRSGDLSGE